MLFLEKHFMIQMTLAPTVWALSATMARTSWLAGTRIGCQTMCGPALSPVQVGTIRDEKGKILGYFCVRRLPYVRFWDEGLHRLPRQHGDIPHEVLLLHPRLLTRRGSTVHFSLLMKTQTYLHLRSKLESTVPDQMLDWLKLLNFWFR